MSVAFAAGDRIGQYEVIGPAGCGGIAEVYHARDPEAGTDVAIKLLRPEVAGDTGERQRLAREARTETTLRHPNILECYATGEWNGRPYLVTEYIGGESLRHQLGNPLPVLLTIDIALGCLEGLGAAHHAGVIHRDLKPDNIMIDRSGSVKLLDFGLARECDRQATLNTTRPGTVLGSVHYISPEQARGLPVDARTDLWSVGVILHEMLTGVPPFRGETTAEILIAIVEREPSPVRGPLGPVIRRALMKDPDRRYLTAQEFSSDLKRIRDSSWSLRLRRFLAAGSGR